MKDEQRAKSEEQKSQATFTSRSGINTTCNPDFHPSSFIPHLSSTILKKSLHSRQGSHVISVVIRDEHRLTEPGLPGAVRDACEEIGRRV